MPTLSEKERAARFKYKGRVEKAVEKLTSLLEHPPEGYETKNLNRQLIEDLVECFQMMTASEIKFGASADTVGVEFLIPVRDRFLKSVGPQDSAEKFGEKAFYDWIDEETDRRDDEKRMRKVTRNAFCKNVLGAQMANPRWAWVGVKEGMNGEPGALYIFGWAHKVNRNGNGTLELFHQHVSSDGKGRKRPGHRDALEKLDRVQSGELLPFIVWQRAEDEENTTGSNAVKSINGLYVTACDLFVDDKGFWNARLENDVRLSACNPSG